MADLTNWEKAERIVALFRERRPIDVLPRELYPVDLEEAYAIRAAFQAIEETDGRGPIAGWKIAITTKVMQDLCGIGEPCYGAIFESEVHQHRAELRASEYCRLGIETEIAVRLGADLPQGGGREEVAAAVESATAAIELIEDLRYDYKRIEAPAIVAGNAWNAGIVLGEPNPHWRGLDLAALRGSLRINGEEVGIGRGSDVMGHPLNALSWLANKLAQAGTPLKAGMVVMTGSIVATRFPVQGEEVEVEISGLGRASLRLG